MKLSIVVDVAAL